MPKGNCEKMSAGIMRRLFPERKARTVDRSTNPFLVWSPRTRLFVRIVCCKPTLAYNTAAPQALQDEEEAEAAPAEAEAEGEGEEAPAEAPAEESAEAPAEGAGGGVAAGGTFGDVACFAAEQCLGTYNQDRTASMGLSCLWAVCVCSVCVCVTCAPLLLSLRVRACSASLW